MKEEVSELDSENGTRKKAVCFSGAKTHAIYLSVCLLVDTRITGRKENILFRKISCSV